MTTNTTPTPGSLAIALSPSTGRTFFGIVTAEDGEEEGDVVLSNVFYSLNSGQPKHFGHDRLEVRSADLLDLTDPEVRDEYTYDIGRVLDIVADDIAYCEEEVRKARDDLDESLAVSRALGALLEG